MDEHANGIQVVQYSSLDDTVYLRWHEDQAPVLAAVPKRRIVDEDPHHLCQHLRRLGAAIPTAREADTAAALRTAYTRRFDDRR